MGSAIFAMSVTPKAAPVITCAIPTHARIVMPRAMVGIAHAPVITSVTQTAAINVMLLVMDTPDAALVIPTHARLVMPRATDTQVVLAAIRPVTDTAAPLVITGVIVTADASPAIRAVILMERAAAQFVITHATPIQVALAAIRPVTGTAVPRAITPVMPTPRVPAIAPVTQMPVMLVTGRAIIIAAPVTVLATQTAVTFVTRPVMATLRVLVIMSAIPILARGVMPHVTRKPVTNVMSQLMNIHGRRGKYVQICHNTFRSGDHL